MKKIVALLLCLVLAALSVVSLAEGESDKAYVTEKGTLIVGITDFAPMDYKDENGEWIGFDADLARAFAESLGVNVVFQEIDWDNKVLELDAKTIDCVWNGMTLRPEVLEAMECSKPYMSNSQAIIVPEAKLAEYDAMDNADSVVFAVEAGSSGEEVATALGFNANPVQSQAAALMEVKAGTSDAAIIDILMAGAMIGEGTSYEDLVVAVSLNAEEYGVGFRKNSDLAAELDAFLDAYTADGSMLKLAETYGVQYALIQAEE